MGGREEMTMRLIDLKVLLELVKKNAPFIYSILLPIAKLCPTIEAEPVRHGWISVKEQMPPTEKPVLVALHNKSNTCRYVEIDIWEGRNWLVNADWHIVTHWMPLPAFPDDSAKMDGGASDA
jgi:hypothetical protein